MVSIYDDKIVIVMVFCVGLLLYIGFLNMFDYVDNVFVFVFCFYKDDEYCIVDVYIEYIVVFLLNDRILFFVDFMFVIGESMEFVWKVFFIKGKLVKL